ncbi:hypothetical protein BJV77DRAFT_1015441 [Russula vinacea]|nr:hypothetical protein BJV77DRAFT_1015441 [Russula vinacea]
MFFDGGSLVTIPAIRTVVTRGGVDTRENQIEALRVLSAGNTLIIVLLGGVLALQVHETAFVLWRAERRSHTFYGAHRAQGARRTLNWREWRQRKRRKEKA